jgi:hypothetical protein
LIQLGATAVPSRDHRRGDAIVADVRSGGGFPIVTHPVDPKRPWDGSWEKVGGLEIANAATSARRLGGWAFLGLAPVLAAGLVNAPLALAQTYDRDGGALRIWDRNPDPGFIGFCGVDSHGRIDVAENLRLWTLVVEGSLPSAASERPAWLLGRLTSGRFYCSAGLFGPPAGLTFAARRTGSKVAGSGTSIDVGAIDELFARIEAPLPGERLLLFRNGIAVGNSTTGDLHYTALTPGTYRVEVWLSVPNLIYGEHEVPIAYSNRIRISPVGGPTTTPASTPATGTPPAVPRLQTAPGPTAAAAATTEGSGVTRP